MPGVTVELEGWVPVLDRHVEHDQRVLDALRCVLDGRGEPVALTREVVAQQGLLTDDGGEREQKAVKQRVAMALGRLVLRGDVRIVGHSASYGYRKMQWGLAVVEAA